MLVIKTDRRDGNDPPQLRGMPDRYERVRALRTTAIQQFTMEQQRSLRWIRLGEVAWWCRVRADPAMAADERDEYYCRVLCSLLDAALAGEFVAGGRSRLFRAHRNYRISQRWLKDPNSAPPTAFVSQKELGNYLHGSSDPEISRKVALDIIANCWVPREMAVNWLNSLQQPIAVPPAWVQPPLGSGGVSRTTKGRQGRKPKYDYDDVEQFVFQQLEQRGDFEEFGQMNDWNCQKHLEDAVRSYMSKPSREEPAPSTVRRYAKKATEHWRRSRCQVPSGQSKA
jgi:hypothetical protein